MTVFLFCGPSYSDSVQQMKGEEERRNPANIHLFKVNYRNTRRRCKICLKLTE